MNKLLALVIVAAAARVVSAGPPDPHPLTPEELRTRMANEESRIQTADERAASAQRQNNFSVTSGVVNSAVTWGKWGVGTIPAAQEFLTAYHALTSFDATCIDVSAAGAPPVPSACAENERACGRCYGDAYRELGEARLKLERLRCLYQATKRFADRSIAFGDTSSGVHALVGLEWQTQKKQILASVEELNRSYDAKLAQFIDALKNSLEHVGQCEQQFMHEPDWYTRFGFIYFTFMKDRYKRS